MLRRFLQNIEKMHLTSDSDSFLVGVSGGIDSAVLLDLLDKGGFSFALAHCNFQLRGNESDKDEKMVGDLAKKYDKPLFKTQFDTQNHAAENGISIEMAARELRYKWFEEVRVANRYDWIAVAHHRDDQLETFFLNLARGTGIQGLTGMQPINGKIVRPLLFASRLEIEAYRFENHLEFREDQSNQDINYQRNKIRHQLLPLMEELNPSVRENLSKTMAILQDVSTIYYREINQMWERVAIKKEDDYHISIAELKMLNPLSTFLFEFLKPFLFNNEVVAEIIGSLGGAPGKQFFSSSHRLVLDRDNFILSKIEQQSDKHFYLDESSTALQFPLKIKISRVAHDNRFRMVPSPKIAYIDVDKLQFPLLIRHWQTGDYFRPLGMIGFKKLSDFFVDEKFSLAAKERTWLLANGEQIIWVIGHRLDDRFKITDQTTNILKVELFD